jgi:hypothetical protein
MEMDLPNNDDLITATNPRYAMASATVVSPAMPFKVEGRTVCGRRVVVRERFGFLRLDIDGENVLRVTDIAAPLTEIAEVAAITAKWLDWRALTHEEGDEEGEGAK